MMQLVSFVNAHFSTLVAIFAIASVVAAALDAIAKAIAKPWPRAAHTLSAIASLMPQVIAAAVKLLSAISGRPFVVPGRTPAAAPQTALPPNASQR